MPRGKGKIITLVSFSVLFVDQLTKLLVGKFLYSEKSISIIPNVLSFSLVKNTGAAFGILHNLTFIFIVTAIFVIFYIIYLILIKKDTNINPILLGLFLGGTIGNLVDRVRFGYVIDFIDFHIWPVFNIADSAITISIAWFMLQIIKAQNVKRKVQS
ncbi:MAG: signal peptidase II [Candidatus Omnitrophota bacterium]